MRERESARANDVVLLPLLHARGESSRAEAMERLLVSTAAPVVDGVVRRKSGRFGRGLRFLQQDEEHIRATVIYRIARRLTADLEHHPIAKFADSCAAVAMHACDDHLRERTPELCSIRRRVFHILRTDYRFTCWMFENQRVCGRVAWAGRPPRAGLGWLGTNVTSDLAGAVDDLFARAGAPLILSELVSLLGPGFAYPAPIARDVAPVTLQSAMLQTSELLSRTWHEIALLPYPQRTALLLNLRDENGRNALIHLPLTGIATIPQIASVLEMDVQHLARIWKDLPLPDLTIARELGVARQRVINLRQAARKRLSHRVGREQV